MQECQYFFSRFGRKPPEGREFSGIQIYRFHLSAFLSAAKSVFEVACMELGRHGPVRLAAWEATLSEDDRQFLGGIRRQRNLEVHQRGAKVEDPEHDMEITSGPPWLIGVTPERYLVLGERRYGGYFAAGRMLGLMASFLGYVDNKMPLPSKGGVNPAPPT
jgi:hypothetical protein